jgi:hypothetical protein
VVDNGSSGKCAGFDPFELRRDLAALAQQIMGGLPEFEQQDLPGRWVGDFISRSRRFRHDPGFLVSVQGRCAIAERKEAISTADARKCTQMRLAASETSGDALSQVAINRSSVTAPWFNCRI